MRPRADGKTEDLARGEGGGVGVEREKKRGRLCTQSLGSTLPRFRIPKVKRLGFAFAMTVVPWI